MKKMICLMLTLVCLLGCAGVAEETGGFAGYVCAAMDGVNMLLMHAYGGEERYVGAEELSAGDDCCIVVYSENNELTAMLQPDETGLKIGSGVIWTKEPDYVADAFCTLTILTAFDDEISDEAVEIAAQLDALYSAVMAMYENPDLDRSIESADAINEEFTGSGGRLHASLSAVPTDDGVLVNLTFRL